MPTLQFKGKNSIWNHHLSVPYHSLEEVEELHFQPEKSEGNFIVEGDNLLALKALLPKYAGRIKFIYIDPPYNTGKEDWVYSDKVNSPLIREWLNKVVSKDDLTKHDKWLCMMSPRIKMLHDLLDEGGLIFISCDNNEVHHLTMIMDEIFQDSNHLGNIIWKNATDNNPTNIATEHEYILCYAKNKEFIDSEWKSPLSDAKDELIKIGADLTKKHSDEEDLIDAYKEWFRENKKFLGKLDRYKYIDKGGVYTGSQSVHNPGKEGYRYDIIHPDTKKPCKEPLMGYRFPESTMKELIENEKIIFGDDEDKIVELKVYAHEYVDKLPSWIDIDGRLGAYDLRELFGNVPLKNPKPVQLIEHILPFVTKSNDIILDSFAGSGTTMHAIHALNQLDGGNRKCVLVQMTESSEKEPDKNICRDITRERVKRAIEMFGYDAGFKYLRVGSPIDPETMLDGDLPTYQQFAEYVYYLATGGHLADKSKVDASQHFVGMESGQAVYLIYEQDMDKLTRLALTLQIAESIVKHSPGKRRVVFAPSCFLDEEYMNAMQIDFVSVPYNLFERKNNR
ncbi:MAG: site-specific DNA-methyltransferase [Bacteroidales bacterium]|nr:site-specific DNA-methyltransferase [Bacteroidales bacterium]